MPSFIVTLNRASKTNFPVENYTLRQQYVFVDSRADQAASVHTDRNSAMIFRSRNFMYFRHVDSPHSCGGVVCFDSSHQTNVTLQHLCLCVARPMEWNSRPWKRQETTCSDEPRLGPPPMRQEVTTCGGCQSLSLVPCSSAGAVAALVFCRAGPGCNGPTAHCKLVQ